MPAIRSGSVLRQIGELFAGGAAGASTDGELLARFLAGRGESAESAFATIVERHGPMVLRVCRILLGDAHEAEDAAQATFLVLARRAGSLRNPERLANWLYGVAHRTARRIRSRQGRRRLLEARESAMNGTGRAFEFDDGGQPPLDLALARREEAAIVHQELERLPEKHRTAIVLCCLEGLTIEEAARRLRCTSGAVRGRLAQARSRLRGRLARRGVAVPAGVVAAALATDGASAALASAFRDATTRAAIAYATGAGTGAAAATAGLLADGVSRSLAAARLTGAAAIVAGVSVLGAIATPLVMNRPRSSPPATSHRAPAAKASAPAATGAGPRDHRRLVEGLEWFVRGVDPARGTIALDDLPDSHEGDRIALTSAGDNVGPTGLTLRNLAAGPAARITVDGRPANLSAIRPGMRVAVRLAPDRFAAAEIRASSPQPPAFLYTIKEIDPEVRTMTVTVKDKDVTLGPIRIADDARIERTRTQRVGHARDSAIRLEKTPLRNLTPGLPVSLTLDVTEGGGLVARSVLAGDTPVVKEKSP